MTGERTVRKGDIFFADLSPVLGSEQGGICPVVVVQNNVGNYYSPTVIVLPLSRKISHNKKEQKTHYLFYNEVNNDKPIVALAEQMRVIDKGRLRKRIGKMTDSDLQGVMRAVAVSVGLEAEWINYLG